MARERRLLSVGNLPFIFSPQFRPPSLSGQEMNGQPGLFCVEPARMKNRQDLERRQVCELYGFGLIYKGFRQSRMERFVVNRGMRLGLL